MSMIQRLFKTRKAREIQTRTLEITNPFTSFSGTAYANATFRAAVDAISRHAAKLQAQTPDARLTRLFQTPNPYMSGYDLLYKTSAAYFTQNNAFILLQTGDGGSPEALYPLNPSSVEFKAAPDGELYANMIFPNGREALFSYGDIVHLRRHYYTSDLLGDNNAPLSPILETAHVLNEGIQASVKNGVNIRGVLKFTSLVNPEQLRQEKAAFVRDYFGTLNSGGIAAVDQRFDFVPTTQTPYSIPKDQIEAVNRQIYDFLGISAKIVSGDYSENEFAAFYESLIEPLAMQMSLEFTRKIYSERERAFGNEITFSAERLEFSSADTKIKLLHEAAPLGLLSLNEARRLLSLPPVPDGERRLQSLNYVNAAKADTYQIESEESDNGKA